MSNFGNPPGTPGGPQNGAQPPVVIDPGQPLANNAGRTYGERNEPHFTITNENAREGIGAHASTPGGQGTTWVRDFFNEKGEHQGTTFGYKGDD